LQTAISQLLLLQVPGSYTTIGPKNDMKLAVMAMAMVESWDEYRINQHVRVCCQCSIWVGLKKCHCKSQNLS
jgi:hypothetical protein